MEAEDIVASESEEETEIDEEEQNKKQAKKWEKRLPLLKALHSLNSPEHITTLLPQLNDRGNETIGECLKCITLNTKLAKTDAFKKKSDLFKKKQKFLKQLARKKVSKVEKPKLIRQVGGSLILTALGFAIPLITDFIARAFKKKK